MWITSYQDAGVWQVLLHFTDPCSASNTGFLSRCAADLTHFCTSLFLGPDVCLAVLSATNKHDSQPRGPAHRLLQLLHFSSDLLADILCYLLSVDDGCCLGCWCGCCCSCNYWSCQPAALWAALVPACRLLQLLHVLERGHAVVKIPCE